MLETALLSAAGINGAATAMQASHRVLRRDAFIPEMYEFIEGMLQRFVVGGFEKNLLAVR
jgi:hypothetical protein